MYVDRFDLFFFWGNVCLVHIQFDQVFNENWTPNTGATFNLTSYRWCFPTTNDVIREKCVEISIWFGRESNRRKGRRKALDARHKQDRVRWFNSATTSDMGENIHTHLPFLFHCYSYCYQRCDKRFLLALVCAFCISRGTIGVFFIFFVFAFFRSVRLLHFALWHNATAYCTQRFCRFEMFNSTQ